MKYHVALCREKNIILTATYNGGTTDNFRLHFRQWFDVIRSESPFNKRKINNKKQAAKIRSPRIEQPCIREAKI